MGFYKYIWFDKLYYIASCFNIIYVSGQVEDGQPTLFILGQGSLGPDTYLAGETFKARCEVTSRGTAKISWSMHALQDVTPITDGLSEVITSDTDGYVTTTSQTLTKVLTPDDNYKGVMCKNEYYVINGDHKKIYTGAVSLSVEFPPEDPKGQYALYGLNLNKRAQLLITIPGNPPPQIEWTVNEENLVPGLSKYTSRYYDKTGRITVLKTNEDDILRFGATKEFFSFKTTTTAQLRISSIEREDIAKTYYVRARNRHGCRDYMIKLSTESAPEGCVSRVLCVTKLNIPVRPDCSVEAANKSTAFVLYGKTNIIKNIIICLVLYYALVDRLRQD